MDIKNTGQMDLYTRVQMQRPESVRTGAPQSQAPAASATAKADTVTVSNEAVLHTEAFKAASNGPSVRQDKVDTIKAQLNSGTYKIDAKRIASQLLTNEAVLMRR